MKFLIEVAPTGLLQSLTPAHLTAAKALLEEGHRDGSIDCIYSKIGGGAFAVVNSTSPDTLRANLRAKGICNATVTSVDPLADVISGYIAARSPIRWRMKWSIGIYIGSSPFALAPVGGVDRPVLSAADVTDVPGRAVADPFLLRRGGLWYLFFEVWNADSDRGELAYATSRDGLTWTYGAVILRESFHLSYPQVIECDGEVYMIPETRQDNSVRLYRAEEFPTRWRHVRTLLRGPYADATLLRHQDRWWLFAQRGLDELRLFMGEDRLDGAWREHPSSPLFAGNRRRTRPGGRMLSHEGRIIRFAQDGLPSYGSRLLAFEVDRLDETGYAEHERPESPILKGTRSGWNAIGMHHIDALPLNDGQWLAAVDGATVGFW